MRDDDAALGGGPSHNPVGKPGPVKGGGVFLGIQCGTGLTVVTYVAEDDWC